jgi:predicted DNA-binding transcriptional regulator AlpA
MTQHTQPLLVRPAEAAALLGLSLGGLRDRVRRGVGPLPIRVPGGRPRFALADIEAWIASQSRSARPAARDGEAA